MGDGFQAAVEYFQKQEAALAAPQTEGQAEASPAKEEPTEKTGDEPVEPKEGEVKTAAEDETSTDGSEDEHGEDQPPKPKRKGGFQKKIERLSAENEVLRQQLMSTMNVNQRTQQPEPTPTSDVPPFLKQRPKMDEFTDIDAYYDAVADYKLDKREYEAFHRQRTQELQRQQAEVQRQGTQEQERLVSMMREATDKYEDFEEVTDELGKVLTACKADGVAKALFRSKVFPELAYKLGTDLKEAKRIAKIEDPDEQITELKLIERKIKQEQLNLTAKEKKPEANRVEKPATGIPPKTQQQLAVVKAECAKSGDFSDYFAYMDKHGVAY
jgi:hypothetical protein